MKRRDFLLKSGGVIGAMIPAVGAAQSAPPPCYPGLRGAGGGAVANCEPPVGPAPGWFAQLTHLECTTPVSNWLGASGVKDPLAESSNKGITGHESIIIAWTGMGVDQDNKTAFMLHNGGHNDYYGNEVYSVDFSSESPAWIRRRNASVSDGGPNTTKFSDGNPSSDHTANLHIAAEGRWFTPGMASTNYNGFANYYQWWEYNTDTESYIDLGGSHSNGSLAVHGLALWDPNARHIIVVHDNNYNPSIEFQDIDKMSGSPALTNNDGLSTGQPLMGAVDTTNKVLLIRSDEKYYFVRIDNDTNRQADWTAISASGTPPHRKHQFHWHAPSGAFITWGGGNSIRKLTPTVSGGTYTGLSWNSASVSGVSIPSSGPSQGMYDKVNMIEDMGNGDAALIIVPRYADPDTFVIRISGAV